MISKDFEISQRGGNARLCNYCKLVKLVKNQNNLTIQILKP